MAQTWGARLRVSVEDVASGSELLALRHTYPDIRHLLGPTTVYLKPGETWYPLDIPGALLAQATVSGVRRPRAVALLVTDTPGVKYLLSNAPAAKGAMVPTRLLLTGSENTRNQNFLTTPTPVYDGGGNWLNQTGAGGTYNLLRKKLADDQQVSYGGDTLWADENIDGDGTLARAALRYIWGRENQINLGATDDGIEFDFWVKAPVVDFQGFVRFGSYPYNVATREEDLADTDGDGDDTAYLTDTTGGPLAPLDTYFQCNIEIVYNPSYLNGVWNHYRLRKQDFTPFSPGADGPDWSRITWMEFFQPAVSGGYYVGPLVLTGAGMSFRTLDLCALEILHWNDLATDYPEERTRDRATLCLFGPPSHGANVKVYWGLP